MTQKPGTSEAAADKLVKNIRRKTRQHYSAEERKLADRAYVFDNSQLCKPHQLATVMKKGQIIKISENVPVWARTLYKEEFQNFSQTAYAVQQIALLKAYRVRDV